MSDRHCLPIGKSLQEKLNIGCSQPKGFLALGISKRFTTLLPTVWQDLVKFGYSFFKKMVQSRPLFVYFRSFLVTISIQIEKSIDGVLGIRTRGCRMVGADKTTELWRPHNLDILWWFILYWAKVWTQLDKFLWFLDKFSFFVNGPILKR